ncbi:MAG: peptidase S16, partial [Anaerolineae bacterium]|nr:peptidase S16 [Anaerolineae bacterium]
LRQLPAEPLALANLAATLLQIPAEQKQSILAAPDAAHMIDALRQLYRRELMLLNTLLKPSPHEDAPFSLS